MEKDDRMVRRIAELKDIIRQDERYHVRGSTAYINEQKEELKRLLKIKLKLKEESS